MRGLLRQSALDRRATLTGWETTARQLAGVLSGLLCDGLSGEIGGGAWQTR